MRGEHAQAHFDVGEVSEAFENKFRLVRREKIDSYQSSHCFFHALQVLAMEATVSKVPNSGAPETPSTPAVHSESNVSARPELDKTPVHESGRNSRDAGRSGQDDASRREARNSRGGRQGKKRDMGRKEWA